MHLPLPSERFWQYPEVPEELTPEQIDDIIEAFGKAAKRAKNYGFDAVQLHGAHGYLINQFLSPLANQRNDKYGGSFENRSLFLMEVYRKVRNAVGEEYPILIKLNGSDFLNGGLTLDDSIHAAKLLDEEGIDAIEVSGGTGASGKENPVRTKIDMPEKEGYNLVLAESIKKSVKCPVIAVGGFRTMNVIEKAITSGSTDCIAMSRPLIREPELPMRWQQGNTSAAHCISCNGCFQQDGIYCTQKDKVLK